MADRPATIEAEDALVVPYDTSDPEQVNAARKKDGRQRRARLDVVGGIMDLKEGRAWMYGMLEFCHLFQTSYVHGDPHGTAFKCGEHNVGLRMLSDVMAVAPKQYVTMCEEASGRV